MFLLNRRLILRTASAPAVSAAILLLATTDASSQLRDQVGFTELSARLGGRPPVPLITYIPRGDANWNFRKGLSQPTADPSGWRAPDYALDATWEEATLPIGYGDDDDNTVLSDMRRSYQSVYLRKTFTIEGTPPASLLLRFYVDDGAVIWINGIEVARARVGDGELLHDASAVNHEAAWDRILLTHTDGYLVEGANTVAAHAINQSATSSDFSFDLELVSPRVTVAQVEASVKVEIPPDSENFEHYFLPQGFPGLLPGDPSASADPARGEAFSGSGDFAGTLIRVQTVNRSVNYAVSGHARAVSANLYGANHSLFPDLSELECYQADDWLDRAMALDSAFAPSSGAEWIQNHSWIQKLDDEATLEEQMDALLRIDHAAERDSVLSIVGLNNGSGTTVPPLMATAYNVISIGLTNGRHSRGGTTAGFAQPGRAKPELVAPHTATSYATAAVSSAAAFLLDEVFRDLPARMAATYPEVMKAILMAGATQGEFAQWRRSSEAPLDPIFGAGELNLSRSHHILTRGAAQAADAADPVIADWAEGEIAGGNGNGNGGAVFSLQIPRGFSASRMTAALCWNRHIDNASTNGGFIPEASLPDMSLTLTSTNASEDIIDSSMAPIGNVEYLVIEESLPSGGYALQVTSDLPTRFGIAWILETEADRVIAPKPVLLPALRPDFQGGRFKLLLLNLVPGETYRLEQSSNLTQWEAIEEIVAVDSASDWEPESGPANPTFYRLLRLRNVELPARGEMEIPVVQ